MLAGFTRLYPRLSYALASFSATWTTAPHPWTTCFLLPLPAWGLFWTVSRRVSGVQWPAIPQCATARGPSAVGRRPPKHLGHTRERKVAPPYHAWAAILPGFDKFIPLWRRMAVRGGLAVEPLPLPSNWNPAAGKICACLMPCRGPWTKPMATALGRRTGWSLLIHTRCGCASPWRCKRCRGLLHLPPFWSERLCLSKQGA